MARPQPPQNPLQSIQLQIDFEAVAFDPDGFDGLIRANGVKMLHFRSLLCPVGLQDPDDTRRPHDHHADCSNGFIYTPAGEVTIGFLNNSSQQVFVDPGRLDGSTVNAVIPRTYDDSGDRVDLAQHDRLYLKDEEGRDPITVTTNQVVAASVLGDDRLAYPVVEVVDLVDANGRRYAQGVHFDVVQGRIRWVPNVGPGVDAATTKGIVYSVRYRYRPFWYVKNLVHEARLSQTVGEDGERALTRFPQQAVLQREFWHRNAEVDPDVDDPEHRQRAQAPDGQFGPR